MYKALWEIALILLISVIVPTCHGILNPNLDGRIIVYVFTPYDDNGNVNLDLVPQLAEYLAKNNIKNVHVLGFYGEGPIIALPDRKALVSAWVKETDRLGLNLIVEIGVMPFPDQLELARFCSQINVSAITAFPLLVYEAKTEEEIIEDYQRLSDAAPNVALLYDAYTETDPIISPAESIVSLMGKVKTFAGGIVSINIVLDVEAAVPSIDGYQFWIYGNRAIVPCLVLKRNGTIINLPNLCPKLALAMEAAVDAGDIDLAFDLQQKLNRLIQAITSNNGEKIEYNSRSYFKYLRATFRIFTGMDLGARVPFEKANSTELDRIRCNLEEFEDFINCYCK